MNVLLFEVMVITFLFRCAFAKQHQSTTTTTTTTTTTVTTPETTITTEEPTTLLEDTTIAELTSGPPVGKGIVFFEYGNSIDCNTTHVSEAEVLNHILPNYTKSVRPVKHANEILEVTVAFSLKYINDIREKEGIMLITGHVTSSWIDQYLTWNNISGLNCVDSIYMPSQKMFLPDLAIINSYSIYEILTMPGQQVIVYSDGRCLYFPESTFHLHCNFDFFHFPFDEQVCPLVIESWASTTSTQRFIVGKPAFSNQNMTENEQWRLEDVEVSHYNVTYEIANIYYDRVEYLLLLRRKTSYYVLNVVGPAFILAFVELFTFTLPTDEVHKMGMGFTCLLSYTMFQTLIVKDLPRSSQTPSLTIFVIMQMACIGLALFGLAAVFICNGYGKTATEVPEWLYNSAMWVGRVFGMHLPRLHRRHHQHKSDEDFVINNADVHHHHINSSFLAAAIDQQSRRNTGPVEDPERIAVRQQQLIHELSTRIVSSRRRRLNKSQWRYIAKVVDRITFYAYLFGVICTPVVMFASTNKTRPNNV